MLRLQEPWGEGQGIHAGPPDFLGIKKRTEAEIENLILVHPDFWTFRRLCHYEISLF